MTVLGDDPATGGRAFRDRVGVVLQDASVDRELTVRETIDFFGSAYRRRRPVGELVALVDLEDELDAPVSRLSGR